MANVQSKVSGVEEVTELLAVGIPENLFGSAKSTIGKSILSIHKEIIGYKGGLVNRTGALRRSFKTTLTGTTLRTLSGQVYTKSKYAPIHEEGGTITAKNAYHGVEGGPYLNIPLPANKTARGVTRESSTSVFTGGGYIIKTKSGKFLVMSGAGVPMFVLVKEVTIPKRLGVEKATQGEIPTLLSNLNSVLLEGL